MCAPARPSEGDATRSAGTPSRARQCVGEARDRRGGDEQVDLGEVERLRRRQLAGGRLGALERPGGVGLGDLDGEDVAAVMGEPTPGVLLPVHVALEQLRELGERGELEGREARAGVVRAQQDRAADRGKVEPSRDAGLRVHVARDHHAELGRPRREHAVDQLNARQQATGPVVDVERERSVTLRRAGWLRFAPMSSWIKDANAGSLRILSW